MTVVLLIDDNDDQRARLAEALRERGWIVESARGAKLGLELAARIQPDIVLTELILPDTRGYQIASALRKIVEPLYVIGLTRIPIELHERAREHGFDHVQAKPVDVERLHEHMVNLALAVGA